MKIRRMKKSDIETICESGRDIEGFKVSEISGFWEKEQLIRWVNNQDDVLLVAEENGQIIGYVMSLFHKPTGKAQIENVYVDNYYRRKGIGSKLVRECLKQLREKGSTYISAMIRTETKSTMKFFESVGFNRGYDFAWMEILS